MFTKLPSKAPLTNLLGKCSLFHHVSTIHIATPAAKHNKMATPNKGQISMIAMTTSRANSVAEMDDLIMNMADESCMTGIFNIGKVELT